MISHVISKRGGSELLLQGKLNIVDSYLRRQNATIIIPNYI